MPRAFTKRRDRAKKRDLSITAEIDSDDASRIRDVTKLGLRSSPSIDIIAPAESKVEGTAGAPGCSGDEFPILTPDQRAYWKEIDEKLQEFERLGLDSYLSRPKDLKQQVGSDEEEEDERKLLLRTALTELSGQELALACDPETSVILERIIFNMDGFAMRVLLDRLVGRFVDLCHSRNASHALESLLAASASVLDQEAQHEDSSDLDEEAIDAKGGDPEDLPTMSALLSQACEDMLTHLDRMYSSPSACHVLHTTFLLCFGKPVDLESYRSKKSKEWKSKQAPFRSLNTQTPLESAAVAAGGGENQPSSDNRSANHQRRVPRQLRRQGDRLYSQLRKTWCNGNGVVVRNMISNAATVVLLQLLIEVELDKGQAEIPGSLTDIILDGLFKTTESVRNRSDFVEVSLRDVIASRVIEGIISRLSPPSFRRFHRIYLLGRLGHLCGHPVANFIITKAVSRLARKAFSSALEELEPKMVGCIDNYRIGFFTALVERSASFGKKVQETVVETILKAFGIELESDYRWIFPCLIALMRLDYFRKTVVYNQVVKTSKISQKELKLPESSMQGSLLLQSILNNMPDTVSKIMIKGITDLPLELIIGLSRNPISSRPLDSLLLSPSINHLARYRFILRFIGKFHELADDRIGSRIAETCWAVADVYLKEKIAISLLSSNNEHQLFLQKSSYGNFFLKKLELPLFERQRTIWKTKMATKQLTITMKTPTSDHEIPIPSSPSSANSGNDIGNQSKLSTNLDNSKKKKKHNDVVGSVKQENVGSLERKKKKNTTFETSKPKKRKPNKEKK